MRELSAAKASDTFGRTLLQALAKEQPGKNLFISPLSIFLTLAMTANGAVPETRKALLTGMNLPDDLNVSNSACRELLKALSGTEQGLDLELANGLWTFAPHRFAPAVLARIKDAFGPELRQLEWRTAAPAINNWAADKTRQMVKNVVTPEDFNKLTAFALANAAYFKGLWTTPFAPKNTRTLPFFLADKTPRMVPMMRAALSVQCAITAKYQAVRLPYGKERFQLYAFVPTGNQTPESLLGELPVSRESWRQEMDGAKVQLLFPKLNLDLPRVELRSTLDKLKYLGKNDLTPMGVDEPPGMLYIDKVFHKTKLELDEAGTRAAAATVAIIATRGGGGPPTFYFNRPFVLFLVDEKSQTTLFSGIIHDPA